MIQVLCSKKTSAGAYYYIYIIISSFLVPSILVPSITINSINTIDSLYCLEGNCLGQNRNFCKKVEKSYCNIEKSVI